MKGQGAPEKSRSWAENISGHSDDELPLLRWMRWTDEEPRPRDRVRRCPRDRSSTWSKLVVCTIGVWWRVLVCITMLSSYCTTSFIESHGRRLWHTHSDVKTDIAANSTTNGVRQLAKCHRHQWTHWCYNGVNNAKCVTESKLCVQVWPIDYSNYFEWRNYVKPGFALIIAKKL